MKEDVMIAVFTGKQKAATAYTLGLYQFLLYKGVSYTYLQ